MKKHVHYMHRALGNRIIGTSWWQFIKQSIFLLEKGCQGEMLAFTNQIYLNSMITIFYVRNEQSTLSLNMLS